MASAKMMSFCFLLAAFGIVSTWSASVTTEHTNHPKTADVDAKQSAPNTTELLLDGFQHRRARKFRKMAKYIRKNLNVEFLNDADQLDFPHTSDESHRAKRSIRRNRIPRWFRHSCMRNVCPYSCSSFGRRRRKVCYSCKLLVCHGSAQGPLRDNK